MNTIEKVTRETAAQRVREEFPSFPLDSRLIVLGEMGSTAHGTHGHVIDDYDLMGVVVPPSRYIIGLGHWEDWVRPPDESGLDVTIYSLSKYVRLMLKQNPNVLGLLWLQDENYHARKWWWDLFVSRRREFASKAAYQPFIGYATSQLKKAVSGNSQRGYNSEKRKEMVAKFGYDTKNAAHLIRLLRMGIEFLKNGELNVFRQDREELKAIKRGEWNMESVHAEALRLFEEAKEVHNSSPLPEHPNYPLAEELVMQIHTHYLNEKSYDPSYYRS